MYPVVGSGVFGLFMNVGLSSLSTKIRKKGGTLIVLVDSERPRDPREFACEWKKGQTEIRDFVLTFFLISGLISSWNPSVFFLNKYHP